MIYTDEIRQLIVSTLGIENSSLEEQNSIIADLEEEILTKINVAIIERLDDERRQKLLDLANQGDEEILRSFIESQIPDFQYLIEQVSKEVVGTHKKS
jgi:hypothetical protein